MFRKAFNFLALASAILLASVLVLWGQSWLPTTNGRGFLWSINGADSNPRFDWASVQGNMVFSRHVGAPFKPDTRPAFTVAVMRRDLSVYRWFTPGGSIDVSGTSHRAVAGLFALLPLAWSIDWLRRRRATQRPGFAVRLRDKEAAPQGIFVTKPGSRDDHP